MISKEEINDVIDELYKKRITDEIYNRWLYFHMLKIANQM